LKKSHANVLLGISIFVTCFTVLTILINLDGSPEILFVNGFSMYPAYLPFDMLIIEDVEPDEIDFGDVVIIDNSVSWLPYENYVAHRVVWMKVLPHRISIGTQGDNNPEMDGMTDAEDIVGKVSHRIPFVGYIMAPPFSYGVILGTALAFLLGSKKTQKEKVK